MHQRQLELEIRVHDGVERARRPATKRVVHTFTIDALNIDMKVGPRSEKLFELKSPKPGTYEFYCRITGHTEQVHGTLTVP